MIPLLLGISLIAQAGVPGAVSARSLTVSSPARIAELDMGKLKGEPWRLAWSTDGAQLYLQTMEQKDAAQKLRHYLIPSGGGAPQPVDDAPAWAVSYWTWKSAQAAPGAPALMISVDERRQIIRSTAAPRGAGLAGMGGDASSGNEPGGRAGAGTDPLGDGQNAVVRSMLLKGETIGEWINGVIVPGLTFGWAPKDMQAIAFADKSAKVVIMDAQGQKQGVESSKGARLPAWSEDGSRLAYVQRTGKKKYEVFVAGISREGNR
jgi:hypothetical protein